MLRFLMLLFLNDTASTELYTYLHTLSLPDALPISPSWRSSAEGRRSSISGMASSRKRRRTTSQTWFPASGAVGRDEQETRSATWRSEEHTSELQSLMRISYAVFCLKKKKQKLNISKHRRPK